MRQIWETGFKNHGNGIYTYITDGRTMFSNITIVEGDESAVMFDVLHTRALTQEFIDEFRKYSDKPIKYWVMSHAHGDHFLGAAAVKDAVMIAHEGVTEQLKWEQKNPPFERLQKRLPDCDYSDAIIPIPDILMQDTLKLDLGNRVVEIKYMGQCHTKHDLAMFVPDANFALLADILFYDVVTQSTTGDVDHWMDVLQELIDSQYTSFVPGHGPICGKEGLQEVLDYFVKLKAQAQDVFDGKLTLSDEDASPLELEYIEKGWLEPARIIFATESYVCKLQGGEYKPDLMRIMGAEKLHAEKYMNMS